MGYRIRQKESVQDAIQRIATEQIDKAIAEIEDAARDRHEVIHQVRKRCKKLRALVRLVRPALGKTYQRENARFRDIARDLGSLRDEQSLVESLERLQEMLGEPERHRFDQILGKLRTRRDEAADSDSQDPDALLSQARKKLVKARNKVAAWSLDESGFAAMDGGMIKSYARGRKAMKSAFQSGQPEDFHEWRKRVKYHLHHVKALGPLWPGVNRAYVKEGKALADLLGDDHDLALLSALLQREGDALAGEETRAGLDAHIRCEQRRLQGRAWQLGERLFAEKPKALKKRWRHYWRAWQAGVVR